MAVSPPADPSGAEVVPGVRLGSLIADKYRVESVLGVGGMGVVVRPYTLGSTNP